MLGYIAVKDSDWFNNVISGGDVTTSNEVQLELEIAKLINQIGEQQTTIDSTVNLIVSLKNQTDEKQAIIDSMVSLIDSLQANNDNLKKITSKYQTGVSPAVISATKLNVLYIGVDNPISISIPGVSSEKISVSMTNGTINKSGNEWIAKPTSSGIATIMTSTNIDGKTITGKMDYRVKVLPTPIAKIGGRAGGVVDKNFLTAQGGVNAELEDFLFDLRYKVTQFSVVAVTTQGERAVSSTSAAFTDGQKAMINGLTKGQKVFVTGIKASGPAGDVDLRDIVFTINQ